MFPFLTALNDNLANGQISFEIIDGEPYVKVGADTPRPFSNGVSGAVLIWTNPTINSFKTMTIPVEEVTNYSHVIVLSCGGTSIQNNRYVSIFRVDKNDTSQKIVPNYGSLGTQSYGRPIKFNDNAISIEAGTGGSFENYTIPLKIWGIKMKVDFYTYP